MSDTTVGGLFPSGLGTNLQSAVTGTPVSQISNPQAFSPSTINPPAPTGKSSGGGGLLSFLPQALAGGGALTSLIKGPGKVAEKGQIQSIAGNQATQGNQLVGSLASGQLPPGQENLYDDQLQQQIQQIKAKYAAMGLSGSSMEQEDIIGATNQIQNAKTQAAATATNTGLELLNSANSGYGQIAQAQAAQDKNLSDTIADFMKAFGGSSGST